MRKGTWGSFPSVLCVVLEASEAHEDLLQRDLAHRVVFQAILLFGFLQGPEDLQGRAGTGGQRDLVWGGLPGPQGEPQAVTGTPGYDRKPPGCSKESRESFSLQGDPGK